MRLVAARLCAACVLAFCAAEGALANPPVEAFGNLPQFTDWKLSPDAKHLAVIQPQNGKPIALIYTVGAPAGTKPVAYGSPDGVVRTIRWVNNDKLCMELTKTMHVLNVEAWQEIGAYVCIDADGQHQISMGGDLIGVDMADPAHAYSVVSMQTDQSNSTGRLTSSDKQALGLYQVGTVNPTAYAVDPGTDLTVGWVVDEHGKPIARVDQNAALGDDVYTQTGGQWTKIASFSYSQGEHDAIVEGEMFDGPSLAIRRSGATDKLERMDLSGHTKETLFNDPTYDIEHVLTDEWTNRVIGVSYVADKREFRYFDPSREALQKGLEQAFAGNSVSIESMDAAGDKAVVAVDGPKQPTAYLFYDRTTKNASVIANAYPSLTPNDLGNVTPYPYKARDGLDIHAYLTLPPGVTAPKNMPLVVFPHGGPDGRDQVEFDWWAQFMANRGYLVFQPNFRGSIGYGTAFHEAGNGQWGKGMISDIGDGVKKLIADGIADPKRICIVGASYGGYAALAGATFTPDLYACAISFAGVTDVQQLFAYQLRWSNNDPTLRDDRERVFGAKLNDTGALAAISPAMHADQVRAPILLIHADKDVTVPIDQSREELAALEKAGKSVKLDMIDGDDHYLTLSSSRIELLKQTEAFLAQYLGH